MDKLSLIVNAIPKLTNCKGLSASEKKNIEKLVKLGLGEQIVKDALKLERLGEDDERSTQFLQISEASRVIPKLNDVIKDVESLKGFEVCARATKVSQTLLLCVGDLEVMAATCKAVFTLQMYLHFFRLALEYRRSGADQGAIEAARNLFDALDIEYDESKRAHP